jgi:uncharacterized protein
MSSNVLETVVEHDTDRADQADTGAQSQNRQRGPIRRPDGRMCVGRVGAPSQHEATSEKLFFWVPPDALVEKTQLVTCESEIAGQSFVFHAIVDDVCRQSGKKSMASEIDESDGDLSYVPPFESAGFTYASASILRTVPPVFIPPRERSEVLLSGPEEARIAYSADEIERPLVAGLIKNGGDRLAGPGMIDLDYLLGLNGGHMNVNGSAGRGTKSSYLLYINWMLLREARRQEHEFPSDPSRLRIVPIILNVKNYDLFYIDRWNRHYDPERHLADWQEAGVEQPTPFQNVNFYAPQQPGNSLAVATGRTEGVQPYSWSLSNIIRLGLFTYLFAEADAHDANFSALVLDIENLLTIEHVSNDGAISRELRTSGESPTTFEGLLKWVDEQTTASDDIRALRNHHTGTWKKLHRRLIKLTHEGRSILRYKDSEGNPLNVASADTSDPIVVDLSALAGVPELQRFVVATIFRQLKEARTGADRVSGLVYIVTLDELNRFAPRGARDPITQLIETIAAEMRSQGIILLGAQQHASRVSERVVESAAIQVLGRTGTIELNSSVWRGLSKSAQRKAECLPLDEKLIIQDNFREPMHVRVPFPVWAMNPNEVSHSAPHSEGEAEAGGDFPAYSEIIDED